MASNQDTVSSGESFGFVETMGLVAAIETADAMGKAARVRIRRVCNADAGIISVVCQGDLAACAASVAAGKAAAQRMNALLTSNVIARPFEDTEHLVGVSGMVFKGTRVAAAAKAKAPAKSATKTKQGE